MSAFSSPHSMAEKLDFRFAMDEIDASDIDTLLNNAFTIEHDGGDFSFRKPGPKLKPGEVEHDLLSNEKARWVVLETQPPEELVIAAARFLLDTERRVGLVDVLCATSSDLDCTKVDITAMERSRLTILIRKLEGVVWSHHFTALIIDVPSWRTDVQDFLTELGYEDRGGHCWPEDSSHQLTKHTMILGFRKNAPTGLPSSMSQAMYAQSTLSTTTQTSLAAAMVDLNLTGIPDVNVVNGNNAVHDNVATITLDDDSALGALIDSLPMTNDSNSTDPRAPSMEALMSDLFRALPTENIN